MGTRILPDDVVGDLRVLSLIKLTDNFFSVTAIFLAMMAQYSGSRHCGNYKGQLLLQQLKSNLLSLQQFGQCFILAKWIQNMFKDILHPSRYLSASESVHSSRPAPQVTAQTTNESAICPPTRDGSIQTNAYNARCSAASYTSRSSTYQSDAQVTASHGVQTLSDTYANVFRGVVDDPGVNSSVSNDDSWALDFPENDLSQPTQTLSVESMQLEGLQYLADVAGSSGFGISFWRDTPEY